MLSHDVSIENSCQYTTSELLYASHFIDLIVLHLEFTNIL
uniref:Uncharacterized protein n=1 Tax=Arundo donax TaxID=35708 RepID=A0A0A9BPH8_ARUDO